jgi:pantoate--beta-alanine ligase
MGALHDAHIGLVNHSAAACDITVCSIFVNPTQFNDPGDYSKYPVTIEKDIKKLSGANATVLFAPSVAEVYETGTTDLERYDLGYLETILEGQFRPGHFQGVCQVMSRLLKIVQPDRLIMGQKDYQQCMVIRRLLDILEMDTVLETCETLREKDGLAMSSRNMRLTEDQRRKAPLIFQTLTSMRTQITKGDLGAIKQNAAAKLADGGFRVEYVEIADARTLRPLGEWNGDILLVALVAAYLGEVRLIDNMLLNN